MKKITLNILVLSLLCSCSAKHSKKELSKPANETLDEWQMEFWQYDTIKYSSQFKDLHESFPGRYSILIIKDGQIAYEYFQEPYSKDSLIHINSCTKTVISILFGTIFKDHLIQNENMTAIEYFPEYDINDTLIEKIKVKHLLSMSSGLNWKGGIDATDVIQMSNSNDWAKYLFQRKVISPPGEKFHYNSGGSQVISTILHKNTKEGLMIFARENLFDPLGIYEFKWDSTQRGIPKAGWGLHLKMHDMAKLGLLMLKKGRWKDFQIVPEEWVSKMSSNHIAANDNYDYGYQVWIPKGVGVEAFLFIGSYPPSKKIVAVLPELNSVVVYVGENYNTNDLLREFIVPALNR